jgi:hypothetical protein
MLTLIAGAPGAAAAGPGLPVDVLFEGSHGPLSVRVESVSRRGEARAFVVLSRGGELRRDRLPVVGGYVQESLRPRTVYQARSGRKTAVVTIQHGPNAQGIEGATIEVDGGTPQPLTPQPKPSLRWSYAGTYARAGLAWVESAEAAGVTRSYIVLGVAGYFGETLHPVVSWKTLPARPNPEVRIEAGEGDAVVILQIVRENPPLASIWLGGGPWLDLKLNPNVP